MNPYQILGVAKDCTQQEIKKAFRKLAQEAHPDREGGDVERFQAINGAYELLSDEARRKRFDETGQTDKEPSLDDQATELIVSLFASIIEKADFTGDIIKRCSSMIAEQKNEHANDLKSIKIKSEKLRKHHGRIKAKKENIFQMVLEGAIARTDDLIKRAEANISLLSAAGNMLKEYSDSSPENMQPKNSFHEEMMRAMSQHGPFGGRW